MSFHRRTCFLRRGEAAQRARGDLSNSYSGHPTSRQPSTNSSCFTPGQAPKDRPIFPGSWRGHRHKEGEILATGCNEVPRAGGGINWDKVTGSPRDYRDYKLGQDAAAAAKKEVVANALDALSKAGWLKSEFANKQPEELAQLALFSEQKPLEGATIANLLNFGLIVHAEMAAICDAAMRGVGLRRSTLYCTTFPCHMCARHIIAAGIRRVVYIEPYPKSRAKKLYRRSIRVDEDSEADSDAVKFDAFVGIAPTRFLDLFEMPERKDEQGYALNEEAPSQNPKSVTSEPSVSELESDYLAPINKVEFHGASRGRGRISMNDRSRTSRVMVRARDAEVRVSGWSTAKQDFARRVSSAASVRTERDSTTGRFATDKDANSRPNETTTEQVRGR